MVTDSFPELGASARVLRPGDDGYDEARLSFNHDIPPATTG